MSERVFIPDRTFISSCLNCRSLGGAEICLVSKRMFIPDGTPVLVTEYYILTQRDIETLNIVVCSATNVESCLCLKVPRAFLKKPSVPPRDPTLTISVSKIARYFPTGYTQEQMLGIIMQLLERNSRHLMPEKQPSLER